MKHKLPIPPAAPSTHPPTFLLYGFDYSRALISVESRSIYPYVTYVTQHNVLKFHPGCGLCQDFLPFSAVPSSWVSC